MSFPNDRNGLIFDDEAVGPHGIVEIGKPRAEILATQLLTQRLNIEKILPASTNEESRPEINPAGPRARGVGCPAPRGLGEFCRTI